MRVLARHCLRLALCALAGGAVLVGTARAASTTLDLRLGDEIHSVAGPGDLHAYRLDVTAGTRIKVRAHTEDDAVVTLTVRAPDGSVLDADTGDDVRFEIASSAAGVYRFEVTSASAGSAYEIELTGTVPAGGGGGTPVLPGTVHLDAPRGALVRIEVRRLTGALPEVTAVRDGTGRTLAAGSGRIEKGRLRLAPLPVSGPGGLDVDIRGAGGANGTYDVRFKVLDPDDDDGPSGPESERDSRKLVLTLAPGADPQQVADALGYELKEVGEGFIVVETDSDGTEYEDSAAADDALAEVIGAEPNAFLHAPEGSQTNHVILGSDFGRSDLPLQPAMDQIRAASAQHRATGAGVIVAVLDTGADLTHEVLAGRLVAGKDFVGGDDDPSEETNGLDDDGDLEVDEGFGHGTFVAGLVLTVAPNAKVMPIRVLDTDARGTVSAIAQGIEWAVLNGAHVINLSLGMDTRSAVVADAVRYAIGNGVVVVAAAGNDALPTTVSFPATVNGVVAVTATDSATQGPATFANGGPGATVAAPGVAVVGPYPGNQYGTWSGTSFSAGIASGGAALVVQARPALTPAQVAGRFRTTARRAPSSLSRAQRRRLGGGRLDLGRLVR